MVRATLQLLLVVISYTNLPGWLGLSVLLLLLLHFDIVEFFKFLFQSVFPVIILLL